MKNKIILLFIICMLFTGCWNYSELSDFAIITGLGIDYNKDKSYKISAMIANGQGASMSAKEGNSQTTLLTGTGKSITEALRNMESKSAKELYLGHLGVVIIEDKIAKNNVYDIMDALFRNPETLKKYFIILAKDSKSEDILKIISPLESFPSQNIISNIKNSKDSIGYVPEVILSKFLYKTINYGIEPIVPSITIVGKVKNGDDILDLNNSEVKTSLKLDKIGIFKNYRLIDYASIKESKGINIINNDIESVVIDNVCFKNKSKKVITKLDNIKTKIKITGKNKIKIDIKADGSINETNCKLNLDNNKVINKLNKKTANNIRDIVDSALEKSIKLDSDIFGIKNMFYKEKRNFRLKDLKYKINVKINLKTKGSLETTIKEINNEKN